MEFMLIPAGSFMMGSNFSPEEVERKFGGEAKWYKDEHPRHEVRISQPFYLQAMEITVGQWRKFVHDTGYKTEAEAGGGAWVYTGSKWEKKKGTYWDFPGFAQNDSQPVTCVSWNDVQKFIQWLNRQEGSRQYRLPTEAEWEYAARAVSGSAYSFGNDASQLSAYAWYRENSGSKAHAVSGKKPNAWGLYDMHGNVWEWCQDRYGDYPTGFVSDPRGPSSGSLRVFRGGSWGSGAWRCRSAFRFTLHPDFRYRRLGFRLARTF
jgi:formylglycine-generating enzyme required for sulfatase activity